MTFEPVGIGVVGIGDISTVYLEAIDRSPALKLVCVASRTAEKAEAAAIRFGARATSVDALLADNAVELVVDLTPAAEHDRLNLRIIEAGKHLYSEKPFSLSRDAAQKLAEAAARKGVAIGTAPDTFFGAAHQAARRLLDEGAIGKPVLGLSFVGLPGIEYFHPNPGAFYRAGGEPPFDVGPYYITQWINLLGSVRRVFASAGAGHAEREIRRGSFSGTRFAVEVASTFNTILEFDQASVSLLMSLDVLDLAPRPNELFGSAGSLTLAEPLFFGGTPILFQPGKGHQPIETNSGPFGRPNRLDHAHRPAADYRGVGLIDLAIGIREGRPHRTGPDLILHAVEVMEAIVRSGEEKRAIEITSSCNRPAPIDEETDALLIALCRSPFDPS
jgi:predicted dehydrogenase